jgi:hypothetical protein
MSWNLVRSSTVAIATSNGSIKGTGFFISSEGHLLTCAHVVEAAGGWEQIRINGQSVNLVYLGSYSLDDFAVLHVTSHTGKTAPLGLDFDPMDRFLTVGYGRADFPEGASIDGTITDVNPHGNYSNLPMLRLRVMADAQQILGGYSGSPVFDAETQRVIGIVAAYDHKEGALAVPLQTVQEKWAGLKQLIEPAVKPGVPTAKKSAKVFISYRSRDPDLTLAQEFYEALKQAGHLPFMAGASIRIGETWPQRIDQELKACDYFLLLLSAQSAVSEMVTEEVRQAKQLHDTRAEPRPIILPIRVNFPMSSPLNYDLRGYLQRIQQREWRSPNDTPIILQEILDLLGEGEERAERSDELELFSSPPLFVLTPDCPPLPVAEPELPEGQVDLASVFYLERPPIEARCYEAIVKPGALIRIKAPRQMGKTSLMARILHQAEKLNYLSVPLSFQLADGKVFQDLDLFLRWFCVSIGRRLRLPNKFADYWDEIFGSKDNCTAYFEEYLLANLDQPLALGLDEVDLVFQYPEIAADFFGLLRAWHEAAKNRGIWKQLRLVVVHSTEVYIPMNINQSPFNVGLPIELLEFNPEQVQDLAQRHGLNWQAAESGRLMEMVGGHPYLVRVALYYMARQEMTLKQLLTSAPTDAGPYSDHLRRHWWNLKQNPDLAMAMQQVVMTTKAVTLEPILGFKLHSMGLVQRQGNDVLPRCNLYRQYFCDRLRMI